MESFAPIPANEAPAGPVKRVAGAVGILLAFLAALVVGSGFGIAIVAQIAGTSAQAVSEQLQDGDGSSTVFGALVAAQLVVLIAIGALGLGIFGAPALGLTRHGTRRALRLSLPVLILTVVAPGAIALATGERIFAPELGAFQWALIVVLSLAIGLTEELAFRGIILWQLGGARHTVLAVAGSAVLFGLPHLGNGTFANPLSVTLLVGVPFALIRLAGGNIWGLALIHALVDIWAFGQLGSISLPTDTPVGQDVAQVAFHACVGGAYLVWFSRMRKRSPGPIDTPDTGDPAPSIN